MNKILIIEDETTVLENLVELLKAENFQVFSAKNGLEGIELAQKYNPELVLCDITMPEMDGYSVLNCLRKNSKTSLTPFIFLTAKTAASEIRDGMDLGADDYLTKPFSRQELLNAIRARISKQEAFIQKTENKLDDLQKNISDSISQKILKPLEQISMTSELFVQHSDTMKASEIKELGNYIKIHSDVLHRSIQNFFFYKNLKNLYLIPESLASIQNSVTMRPGDFILMISTQKSRKYRRSSDVRLNVINARLKIETEYWKKIIEELMDFAFSFSQEKTSILVNTDIIGDEYRYSIRCDTMNLSSVLHQQIQSGHHLDQDFFEGLDPGLGFLVIQEILSFYGSKLSVEIHSNGLQNQLILSFLLPIQLSEESLKPYGTLTQN